MKKLVLTVCTALVAAMLATGCTSVEVAKNFRSLPMENGKAPVEHINVEITGCYFLFVLPFITGSQQASKTSFFQDNVSVHNAVAILCKEARGEGANKIADLQSTVSAFHMLLFSFRSVPVSATALP